MSISWTLEIWPLFSAACSAFIITYLVGFVFSIPIIGEKKLPPFMSVFFKLGLGYLVIPMAYSIYFTGGYTIYLGVLFLFLILWFINLKEWSYKTISIKIEFKQVLLGILTLCLLMLFQMWRFGYFDDVYFHLTMRDNGIYSTVAEYLKITGIESSSPWYQMIDVSADGLAKMYHFEDFWFFAFLLDFFPYDPLDAYNHIFSPVLATFHFFGCISLMASMNVNSKSSGWILPLAFCAVLFSMVVPGARWSFDLLANTMNLPKIGALAILLPFAFISRRLEFKYLDCLSFGAIIILDPLFMPTILGAATTFYGIKWIKTKHNENLISIMILMVAVVFFVIFHILFGSFENSSVSTYVRGNETYMYSFVKNLVASILRHLIFFTPLYLTLLFLYRYRKKLNKYYCETMIILFLVIFFSSLSRAILSNNIEGFQFDIYVHPVISVFMMLASIAILQQLNPNLVTINKIRKLLIFLLAAQIIYGLPSTIQYYSENKLDVTKEFVASVEKALLGKNKIGAAILNLSAMTSFTADPRICYPCNFLKHIGPGYWANQIKIPSSLKAIKYKERTKAIELSPFYCFIQQLKKEDKYTTFEDAQVSFINTYGVDFVVVEKGAEVPEKILKLFTKKIEDPISGTMLITLKY